MRRHPKEAELLRFAESLRERDDGRLFEHLLECDSCARLALDLLESGELGHRPGGKVLPFHLDVGEEGVSLSWDDVWSERFEAAEAERVEAAGRVEALLALGAGERRERLRDPGQATWAVAEWALESARLELAVPTGDAEALVALGCEVTEALDTERYGERLIEDLRVRGLSLTAELRRRRGELEAAEAALVEAGRHLGQSVDPAEGAFHQHLMGLVCRDRGHAGPAREHFRAAEGTYRELGDEVAAALPLHSAAVSDLLAGRPGAGVPRLEEAVARLAEEGEAVRRGPVAHDLALALAELGRFPEARRVTAEHGAPDGTGPLGADRRGRWLGGRIAAAVGEGTLAERLLLAARMDYEDEPSGLGRVLVSLDLAALHARGSRWDALAPVAEKVATCPDARRLSGPPGRAAATLRRVAQTGRADPAELEAVVETTRQDRINALLAEEPV